MSQDPRQGGYRPPSGNLQPAQQSQHAQQAYQAAHRPQQQQQQYAQPQPTASSSRQSYPPHQLHVTQHHHMHSSQAHAAPTHINPAQLQSEAQQAHQPVPHANGMSGASYVGLGNPPYNDPTTLARAYPFITYQATARTAEHFSPHTTVYPPPSSSTHLYPQHADHFGRLDNPQNDQDWEMRRQAEMQLRGLMQQGGPSYSNHYNPIPDSSSFDVPQLYLPYPQDRATLPYSFMGQYLPPSALQATQPPTPTSATGPLTQNLPGSTPGDGLKYYDTFERNTLQRMDQPPTPSELGTPLSTPHRGSSATPFGSSHTSAGRSDTATPTLARAMSGTALTPGPSPSPSKKQKITDKASPTSRTKSLPSKSTPKLKLTVGSGSQSQPTRTPMTASSSMTSIASSLTPLPTPRKSIAKNPASRVVVEIPLRKGSHVPQDQQQDEEEESEEDDLGWGETSGAQDDDGDWQMGEESDGGGNYRGSSVAHGARSTAPPGSGRTGERDMRTTYQKVQSLFEDIFEESDSFPPNPTDDDLRAPKHFSAVDPDTTYPLLASASVEKVTRYIARLQKGKKRYTQGFEWDSEAVSRILQLLERSMRGIESVEPFPADVTVVKKVKAKGKGKKESKEEKSKSPEGEDQADTLTAEEISSGDVKLKALRKAGLASECVLTILDTEGLSKQLLGEDLLSTSVAVVRDLLGKVIIPIVEALSSDRTSSRYLQHVISTMPKPKKGHPTQSASPLLSSIQQIIGGTLPRITSLLGRSDISFSDQLVIQTVYLAISPLFVSEPANTKKKGKEAASGMGIMKGLRVEALGCLRGVFARYEDQRQWILEEILTTMGQSSENNNVARFQLSNGASIHTITALLLQLIQASTFGVGKRVCKHRQAVLEADTGSQDLEQRIKRENSIDEEMQICHDAMESALKSARIVATYLISRSTASKGSKSSHDTDYKALLDVFVQDLLNVLYRPEWPAATLYLNVLSRIMINNVEDNKSGAADTAAKGLALDYLGDIAAKLRAIHVDTENKAVPSLDDVISGTDIDQISTIASKQQSILHFLNSAAREDGMYACSLDMTMVVWAQELQLAIKKAISVIDKLSHEKDPDAVETRTKLGDIVKSLQSTLKTLWTGEEDLFGISDPNAATIAHSASIAISRSRPLQSAFQPILNALVATMGNTTIQLRSKALRGLGTIVTVDPDVLAQALVKEAIDDRLSDSSASVRDAAVELVGKYVVQKPALATEYYPHLGLRVSDSGLAVRKRVIKLLKGIFGSTTERDIKIDICCKMFGLIGDTDEGIKDLAIKTLTELLYPPTASGGQAGAEHSALLLVDVFGEYEGGLASLESAISEIAKECERVGQGQRLADTVDDLFERLIDATERSDIDPLSHIRAVFAMVTARPGLIDVTKAETLMGHLKQKPKNVDEQATNEFILKIYKKCIPAMPRIASSFATRLSDFLVPMISSPSGGFNILKETVACFCVVATHLTRNYSNIIRVLTKCEGPTRQMRNQWNTTGSAAAASSVAAPIYLFVCGSIAEHINLDELAETDDIVKDGLARISPDQPLHEHFFESFLDFTKMPISQVAPSLCLGSLFRAYPVLILREEAMSWMDGVFAGNDTATQARLLSVVHEFLISEQEKKAKGGDRKKVKAKDTDMEALIGTAADLSESGLSTAVVQRNIQHILDGAKSQHIPTQAAALDIVTFTVTQGLYHPLQILPILISLETSEAEAVAERALELHRTLHLKHSALVNVRFLEFAKDSYEYQRTITSEVVGHRDGQALLSGWYSLVGEKRAWRHDFLKQLCRVFDYDLTSSTVPDVGLVLYICDNLASLEYKLQEEVMTVVHLMSVAVGQSTGLVEMLEKGTLEGNGDEGIEGKPMPTNETDVEYQARVVIHATIVVSLAMITKNHLLDIYGIPEDKCLKYIPGKKTSVGDKPAVRRKEHLLDTSRMSCVRGVHTIDDFRAQRATFLELRHEDGTMDEI